MIKIKTFAWDIDSDPYGKNFDKEVNTWLLCNENRIIVKDTSCIACSIVNGIRNACIVYEEVSNAND